MYRRDGLPPFGRILFKGYALCRVGSKSTALEALKTVFDPASPEGYPDVVPIYIWRWRLGGGGSMYPKGGGQRVMSQIYYHQLYQICDGLGSG